jgi:hypothetical protein
MKMYLSVKCGMRFQRRLRDMQQAYARGALDLSYIRHRIAAWIGHARHADSYHLRASLLGAATFRRDSGARPCAAGWFVEQQQH